LSGHRRRAGRLAGRRPTSYMYRNLSSNGAARRGRSFRIPHRLARTADGLSNRRLGPAWVGALRSLLNGEYRYDG